MRSQEQNYFFSENVWWNKEFSQVHTNCRSLTCVYMLKFNESIKRFILFLWIRCVDVLRIIRREGQFLV